MPEVISFQLTDQTIADLDFIASEYGSDRSDAVRRLLDVNVIRMSDGMIEALDFPTPPDQVIADAIEVKAFRAENERLRAALKAAGESLMYFDVSKRTEAYLKVVKALEGRP